MIAAITSCTNTSNPSVMLGAAPLPAMPSKRDCHPSPGSRPRWHRALRWSTTTTTAPASGPTWKSSASIVGYGCTTCIGNSGPLPEEISKAINDNDLLGHRGAVGQPELRRPHQSRCQDELPGVPAAGHRLRVGRNHGLRLRNPGIARAATARTSSSATSGPRRRTLPTPSPSAIDRDVHPELRRRLHGGDDRWRNLPTRAAKHSRGTPSRPTCASPVLRGNARSRSR